MIYLFIILAASGISIALLKKKYDNPYKLYFIFGKKGSGKSTYLTKLALQYSKKGYKVYSNTEIFSTFRFNINDLGKMTFPENSVILIDEIGMIWDCRDYSKFPKEVRNYFKYQRQYKNIVYMTSQAFDVDKKLRDLCDKIYISISLMNLFNVMKSVSKNISISKADDNNEAEIIDTYRFDFITDWKFTFMPRYNYFFKSFNPPKLEYINGFKYQYPNPDFYYKLTTKKGYRTFKYSCFKKWLDLKFEDFFKSFRISNK